MLDLNAFMDELLKIEQASAHSNANLPGLLVSTSKNVHVVCYDEHNLSCEET